MIEAVGLKDEEDSPFFIENRRVCEFWDDFIIKKGGTVQGKYTAWALILAGNFTTKYDWKIKLKKSTSDSRGIVFRQTLFIACNVHFDSSDFLIRESTWVDKLRKIFSSNIFKQNPKSKYVLRGTSMNQNIKSLLESVQQPIQETTLVSMKYTSKTKQMSVEMRALLTDTVQINKILNFG